MMTLPSRAMNWSLLLQPTPLVSVVIVTHNNWPDLELAIRSALHQSYRAIEVIVVDNSSTDATEDQVRNVFADRVRYARQSNTGEGGGRNAGLRLAAGELIQFLDGDDFLAPDKVEKQVAFLNAAPDVEIVYGDARQFQSIAGFASWEDWDGRDYPDMLATLLSPDGNGAGLVVHSLLFRRRALERTGLWLESEPSPDGVIRTNMADQDYWLRAAWAGCRFRHCPGSLCFQRIRPGQLSSKPRDVLRGMELVLTRAHQYITREPYRTAVSQKLGHTLFYLAISERASGVMASLAKLKKAREVSPNLVTSPAYACGVLLIVTGIGPFVFGRWLKPVRRFVAALAGMNG
jgi:glycosyltransferase involved in cell wall biosynthesis